MPALRPPAQGAADESGRRAHDRGAWRADGVCVRWLRLRPRGRPAAHEPSSACDARGGGSRPWPPRRCHRSRLCWPARCAARGPGASAAAARLLELLLIQAIRRWVNEAEDKSAPSWLAALRDPPVARAVALLQAAPRMRGPCRALPTRCISLAPRWRADLPTRWANPRSLTWPAGESTSLLRGSSTQPTALRRSPATSATGLNSRSTARLRDTAETRPVVTDAWPERPRRPIGSDDHAE